MLPLSPLLVLVAKRPEMLVLLPPKPITMITFKITMAEALLPDAQAKGSSLKKGTVLIRNLCRVLKKTLPRNPM